MKFDINQNEFPSATHKSIWHSAVFMAPFYEVIPPRLNGREANDLREGEKNLYRFMTDLYSDMYDNPEKYYLPVMEYDLLLNGRDWRSLNGNDKKKESNLRNRFQRKIQFYQKLLFEIGINGETEAGTDSLSSDKPILTNVIANHTLRIIWDQREQCAEALSRLGLEIKRFNNKITVSNSQYPKMLFALSALCKAGKGKFALTNFLRCDFRGLLNSYIPGFEDTVSILPDGFKKKAIIMNEFMKDLKCKTIVEPLKNTTLYSEWKLFYSFKGKSIYGFHSDTESLKTFAYFNHYENVSRMGYILKEESDSLYNWFYDCIPISMCSCRNNKLVNVGGREKRICGLTNRIDVINPDDANLKNLKRIIEIYLDKVM